MRRLTQPHGSPDFPVRFTSSPPTPHQVSTRGNCRDGLRNSARGSSPRGRCIDTIEEQYQQVVRVRPADNYCSRRNAGRYLVTSIISKTVG